MSQLSFLSLAMRKTLRCEKFLSEMDAIVPWERWLERIRPHYPFAEGPKILYAGTHTYICAEF